MDLARRSIALGTRPALLLVDMSVGFCSPDSPLGGDFATVVAANLRLLPVAPDVIDGPRLLWDGEPRLTLSVSRDMLLCLAAAGVCIVRL